MCTDKLFLLSTATFFRNIRIDDFYFLVTLNKCLLTGITAQDVLGYI